MLEILQSMGTGLLIGGGYGITGGLTSIVVGSSLYGGNRPPAKHYYAMCFLWPIVLPLFVIFCIRDLVTEIYPLLRGPSKHERALAEIERLEKAEDEARKRELDRG